MSHQRRKTGTCSATTAYCDTDATERHSVRREWRKRKIQEGETADGRKRSRAQSERRADRQCESESRAYWKEAIRVTGAIAAPESESAPAAWGSARARRRKRAVRCSEVAAPCSGTSPYSLGSSARPPPSAMRKEGAHRSAGPRTLCETLARKGSKRG